MFVLEGGAYSPSDINRTDAFDLIEFCEANEVHSEEELQNVVDTYYCNTEDAYSNEDHNSDEVVSFELTIDYENEYVITTTVYKTNVTRSTASGYAVQNYRSSAGFIIFTVQDIVCKFLHSLRMFAPKNYRILFIDLDFFNL